MQVTGSAIQVEIIEDAASLKTSMPPDEDEGVWMKSPSYGSESGEESVSDPWSVQLSSDSDIHTTKWADLNTYQRIKRVAKLVFKPIALIVLLYFFVCSLDLLCSAFRLLGSKTAGQVFSSSEIMRNPIAGLMIGILCTVLVQSSSTSTSVVVSMVGSGILDVQMAIPIIMGANIGTSITNTLVSLAHSTQKDEFRRAFAGATVHDMFNWLTVIVLLPLEVLTGYLYYSTGAIVRAFNLHTNSSHNQDFLAAIVKPLTGRVVELDKDIMTKIALGDVDAMSQSLVKRVCKYTVVNASEVYNDTQLADMNLTAWSTVKLPLVECESLFARLPLSDTAAGLVLLVVSLALLIGCLVLLSKLLGSMLRGRLATLIKKTLNANFPGRLSFLTGYLAMVVGMGLTILVQSSSVFTSALTPLVGIGALTVERMYPLTLGSNIGTTTTGLLAAMACSGNCGHALQIALCHLLFNVSGILLFFPVPAMRWPIGLSKMLGNTTARFRWFAIFYVVAMFFIAPAIVFGLSMVSPFLCFAVVGGVFLLVGVVVIVNALQKKRPHWLPEWLRSWSFLPLWMHSLEPLDGLLNKFYALFRCCCSCGGKSESDKERKQLQKVHEIVVHSHVAERPAIVPPHKPTLPHTESTLPLLNLSALPSAVNLESGYVSFAVTPSVSHAGSYIRIAGLQ